MRVLVVAAHPDDEILGCGGTIAKHTAAGDDVSILIAATGATSRDDAAADYVDQLRANARDAAATLGALEPQFLGLPDNRLDSLQFLDLVKLVERHTNEVDPHVIYTHHDGDLNIDHQLLCRSVLTAARPLPGSSIRAIYSFETLSSTEWFPSATKQHFEPRRYVDIASHLELKMEALASYKGEMRDFPHARSFDAVRALATLRGAEIGHVAAEAFVVLRQID